MAENQIAVAREFGFCRERILKVLRRKVFKNVGELVLYLEHENDINALSEDMKHSLTVKENVESVSSDTNEPMTVNAESVSTSEPMDEDKETTPLFKETLTLYSSAHCLRCRDRKRTIVTLPCCHFTMCHVCSYKADFCPKRSCGEEIKDVITTYM